MSDWLADRVAAGLRLAGVAVLLGILALSGVSFLAAAGWMALAGPLGPPGASVVVGSVLLLPPLAGLALWLVSRRRREARGPRGEIDCARLAFAVAADIGEWLARSSGR